MPEPTEPAAPAPAPASKPAETAPAPTKPVAKAPSNDAPRKPAAAAPAKTASVATPKKVVKPAAKSPPKAPPVVAKAPPAVPKGTVVDVSGLVLGRAASVIAHRLLRGESIVVVNAEKSIVTGSRERVLSFYTANRARGSKRSGPHYPRYPDRIFRRTVRGMLPHLKTRGKEALDRLEVFIGVPSLVATAPRQSIDVAHPSPSLQAPLTLEEITRLLGARV